MKKNILIIINTILCVILLVNQLLFHMVYNVKKIELKKSINYISNNVDTTQLLNKIDDEENKILDKIYLKAKENNIEEKTINKVLNSNEIKTYFKDNININIDSLLNNKKVSEMATNDFNTIIDTNIDKILNNEISNDKKQLLLNIIKEYSEKLINTANIYTNKIVNNKMVKLIKLMLKDITSIILLISTLIIIIIIIMLNHSYYKWAIWSGTTTFISSILISLFSLAVIIFKYGLSKYLNSTLNSFTNILTDNFIKNIMICSLIGLLLGIIQVIYYLIITNKIKRRDKVIKLILLRHGQSVWNMENKFTGWTDVELSKKGIEEAKEAGLLLKKDNFKFDLAYTSVLKRANDTLKYVLEELNLKNINIKYDWRLNERHYGALQGLNKDETRKKYGEQQVHIWRRSADVRPPALTKEDSRYPGNDPKYKKLKEQELPLTENLLDTMDRVVKCFNETIKKDLLNDKQIILVAHGNSIRALIKYLDNISTEEIMNIEIPTGKPLVYELDSNLKPIRHYYL